MDPSILEGLDHRPWRAKQAEAAQRAVEESDFLDMSVRCLVSTPLAELIESPRQSPLLIGAPTGSGKTYAIAQRLNRDTGRLAIAATGTLRAQEELMGYLPNAIDLRHGHKCGPLYEDGELAAPAIVTNHANLHSRGDAPHELGRLFLKLEEARKRGLSRPQIIIDEGDVFLASLARSYPLGHRVRTDEDPRTGLARPRQVRSCPQDCRGCEYGSGVSGYSTSAFDQFAIMSMRRPPENCVTIDPVEWITGLAAPGAHDSHGWQIRAIDTDAAIAESERRPRYRLRTDKSKEPLIGGILAGIAASPGATLRRCYPRDVDSGEELTVAESRELCEDDKTRARVLFPSTACNVWHLVGWDTEPLRLLLDASPDALFLSATWGRATAALLGGVERVDVETPPPRKMAGILLIVVSSFDWSYKRLKALGLIENTLIFRSTREKALAMESALGRSGISGGIFSEGFMRTSGDPDGTPAVTVSYPRSALGRGLNLGSRRIVVVEADVHGGVGYTPLASAERPLEAIEEERRDLISQAVGRALREDESGAEDDLRRVVILVSEQERRHGELLDDGMWLERRLMASCDEVAMVQLNHYPARCVPLAKQYLSGLPITVDDSKKMRNPDPEKFKIAQARREEKRQQRLETKREQLLARIEAEAAKRKPWRQLSRELNLNRYFEKPVLEYMKCRYSDMCNAHVT